MCNVIYMLYFYNKKAYTLYHFAERVILHFIIDILFFNIHITFTNIAIIHILERRKNK